MAIILANVFVLLVTLSGGRFVASLECYSCNSTDNVSRCNHSVHCSSDESCFIEVTNGEYRLGCISNRQCGVLSSVATSIVGRRADDNQEYDVERRELNHCFECCSSNICNIRLCQHLKPTECVDDAKADCAWMNSKFQICQNVHEAKTVCPRFCGLCSLIDGNWGGWSSWSVCDVTCANGTQTRSRSCSNPTPVSGGLQCPGSASESKPCSFPPCPVTPTVAFHSHDLASTTISTGQDFVFTTVTFNAGNGYDKTTGKFTAPLPGTYFFSTQLCLSASTSYFAYYGFVLNGHYIQAGLVRGNNVVEESFNFDITVILNTNDTFWIKAKSTSVLYQSDYQWNTFSGHLVHI